MVQSAITLSYPQVIRYQSFIMSVKVSQIIILAPNKQTIDEVTSAARALVLIEPNKKMLGSQCCLTSNGIHQIESGKTSLILVWDKGVILHPRAANRNSFTPPGSDRSYDNLARRILRHGGYI